MYLCTDCISTSHVREDIATSENLTHGGQPHLLCPFFLVFFIGMYMYGKKLFLFSCSRGRCKSDRAVGKERFNRIRVCVITSQNVSPRLLTSSMTRIHPQRSSSNSFPQLIHVMSPRHRIPFSINPFLEFLQPIKSSLHMLLILGTIQDTNLPWTQFHHKQVHSHL